jgi:NAD(P)H-flavin reductase
MNPYKPDLAKIIDIKKETPDVRTFAFKFTDSARQRRFKYKPGQFIEVSSFGIGESTFGIFRHNGNPGFSVKKMGNVTTAMFRKGEGDIIGIRGPYGNGYPLKDFKRKNAILVAGGIGIPPIRALFQSLMEKRRAYKHIDFFYGARTPKDIVCKREFKEWADMKDVDIHLTVDKRAKGWKGNVGVVTTLFNGMEFGKKHAAAICGPPIMIKFVVKSLVEKGMRENQIYASMERLMQCGFGTCGRCNIGKLYVCKNGPVFRMDELNRQTEKPW